MSAADILVTLAESATLFHTADGRAYASVPAGTHTETWEVKSTPFKAWLKRAFYRKEKKPPSAQALLDTVALLEARALDGPLREVYLRVAEHQGTIYLDLVDEHWRAVGIDATGWRIVASPPVTFRRAPAMLALPDPVPGGHIVELLEFINVDTDALYQLIVCWLTMTLHPHGPYPVLALHGEHGAAKSSVLKVLRALVDPNASTERPLPDTPRDLAIAANNAWLLSFDNVSYLRQWESDALCRLATGGGFATRALYTDDEEVIFSAKRPILLTGIEEVGTRGDLMSRSILVELPVVPPDRCREEGEFWAAFEQARPQLLGALLTAVAGGLREWPTVTMASRPRMADFAHWSVAVEQGMGWPPGAFMRAYTANTSGAHQVVIEASPIGPAVQDLVEDAEWEGTIQELLNALSSKVSEATKRARSWPTGARALSGALRRLAPNLRAVGINVVFGDHTRKGRWVRVGKKPSRPSPHSQRNENDDLGVTDDVTDGDGVTVGPATVGDGVTVGPATVTPTVTHNPSEHKPRDGCDGCDGIALTPDVEALVSDLEDHYILAKSHVPYTPRGAA